jgi:hypothetical protein
MRSCRRQWWIIWSLIASRAAWLSRPCSRVLSL